MHNIRMARTHLSAKIIFTLLVSLVFRFTVWGQEISAGNNVLEELRRKLPEAFLNEKTGMLLFDKYKTIHTNDPLTKGYIASLYFAYSKHASLFKKMEAFNRGRNLMDAAVKASPNNIELAFLRLSVQMNAPG